MLCRPTSLPQHPCPYVGRTVQDRDAGGLALVEKTDALDLHEIDLLQIQRHPGLPSLELGLELAKVLGSNLATQPDSRLSSGRNPFDLERHDPWSIPRETQLQKSGHTQLIAVKVVQELNKSRTFGNSCNFRRRDRWRSPGLNQPACGALNRYFSILSRLILDSRVCAGSPSLAAAPSDPEIRPRLSANAASMISLSCLSRAPFSVPVRPRFEICSRFNEVWSTARVSPSLRITARSMTFCNSRTFPGQV